MPRLSRTSADNVAAVAAKHLNAQAAPRVSRHAESRARRKAQKCAARAPDRMFGGDPLATKRHLVAYAHRKNLAVYAETARAVFEEALAGTPARLVEVTLAHDAFGYYQVRAHVAPSYEYRAQVHAKAEELKAAGA